MVAHAILAAAAFITLLGCGYLTPESAVGPVEQRKSASGSSPAYTPESTVSPVEEKTSSVTNPTEPTATSVVGVGTPFVTVPDSPPKSVVQTLEDGGPDFRGFTTLDERIFHSDLIVRATLRSIEGTANLGCQVGYLWIPVITYEFEALEYLKGMGAESLSVRVPLGASGSSLKTEYEMYGSERDAIAAAISHMSERDDRWDEHEAILFINEKPWDSACTHPMYHVPSVPTSNDSYSFTLAGQTYDVQAQEYRIESRGNRVWLPAVDVPPHKSERFFMSVPPREEKKSITLDEVRQAIAELDRSISRAKAEGIFGYRECLASKYDREGWNKVVVDAGRRVQHGPDSVVPPPQQRRILFSGLRSDKTIVGEVWQYARPPGSELRDRIWLAGPDAHLFQLQPAASESRMDSRGGLLHWIVASRMLPIGAYHFQLHRQPAAFQPCDYHDELSAVDYFIEGLAPRETDQHYARYENCIMGSVSILPSKMSEPLQDSPRVDIRIASTSDCGSTQREGSRSQYQVFEVSSREEIEIALGSCPSIRMYLFEGIGPQGNPLHAFDTDDFREGILRAQLGVLPPGTYTIEVNIPQSEECRTTLNF